MNDAAVNLGVGQVIRCMVRGALVALALAGGGVAQAAASVMIWPIDPVIKSDQRAAALWLENRDTRPVTLQVRVFGWAEISTPRTRTASSVARRWPPCRPGSASRFG